MCGIAARFALAGGLGPADVAEVAAMTAALRHRGPDDEGLLDRSPLAVLGHRRLAIIDLSSGQQPMSFAGERLWITFNGEIYNYLDLRAELEGKGHAFRTRSDTEVILAAYAEWGEGCAERLLGMFAFAILDLAGRRLYAARDHLGKKPLYLRLRAGRLDLASELQALRLASDWEGGLDPVALAFYLRLGYVPSPWSIYRGVLKLRPGEYAVADAGGLRRRLYWSLPDPANEHDLGFEEAVDRIEAELRAAVRERLMSEVPLGAFLSGGIDSPLVVGMMAGETGPGVKTVTVGFSGEPGETEAARLVAEHHRTDHAEYTVQPELGPLLDRMLGHFGEPFADSSCLPTWHVSREARRRVTVALTGDGGDESFGGYDFRFLPHRRDARLRRLLPGALMRGLLHRLSEAWPARHDLPRPLRLKALLRNLAMEEDEAFYHDLCFVKPPLAEALAPDLAREGRVVEEHVRSLYRDGAGGDPLQAIMRADVRFYLPEDVLVKVDRMSMAHSLEVRSPLLSKRVVELAFRLPAALKVRGDVSKALLRRLAARYVPAPVLGLPKRGFHIPLDRWLREELRGPFEDQVLQPSGAAPWLDRSVLSRLWTEHQGGRFSHGYALWALWAYGVWARSGLPAAAPPERAQRLA